jgi:hypothetical protein
MPPFPDSPQAIYRFFDQTIQVWADLPDILTILDDVYAWFSIPIPNRSDGHYHILTGAGGPAVLVDGRRYPCRDQTTLLSFAYVAILNSVFQRVRSHWLVHAAALNVGGRGVLLLGAGGLGKTSLALELARRGHGFLSDDVGAVRRADGHVDPFPKSIGVRPGMEQLFPDLNFDGQKLIPGLSRGEKGFLPIDRLIPGAIGQPAPLGGVFVLSGDLAAQTDPGGVIYLTLDRIESACVADLQAVPGIIRVSIVEDITAESDQWPVVSGQQVFTGDWPLATDHYRGSAPSAVNFPLLQIEVAPGAFVDLAIEAVCDRHGALLLHFMKGDEPEADFDRPPVLVPLSRAETARELVRKFRAGPRSAVLQAVYGGDLGRMFLDLVELLRDVRCFRLQVGRLRETADAICETMGASP